MKNNDPVLKRINRSGIQLGIALALTAVGLLLTFIARSMEHSRSFLPLGYYNVAFSFIIISALSSFALVMLVRYSYKKAEQQRDIALKGDVPGNIALEQPSTNTIALTLPVTLAVQANWRFFVCAVLLPFFLGIMLGCLALYYFFFRETLPFASMNPNVLIAVIGGVVLFFVFTFGVALLLAVRRTAHQYIEVSEHGIRSRFLTHESSISWDEIKLFALWGGKSKSRRAYEVADANSVVRWTVMAKKHWYNSLVPTISFEEYDGQMQAILAMIATKTQLPLYDLRLKWWGGTQK